MKTFFAVLIAILCAALLLGVMGMALGVDDASGKDSADGAGTEQGGDDVSFDLTPYTLAYGGSVQEDSGAVTVSYYAHINEVAELIADGYDVVFGVLFTMDAATPSLNGNYDDGYSCFNGQAMVFYCSDKDNQDIVNSRVNIDKDRGAIDCKFSISNVGAVDGVRYYHRGFMLIHKKGEESLKYVPGSSFAFYDGVMYEGGVEPKDGISIRTTTTTTPSWGVNVEFEDIEYYTDKGYRVMIAYSSYPLDTYISYTGGNIFDEMNLVTSSYEDGALIWVFACAMDVIYDTSIDPLKDLIYFEITPNIADGGEVYESFMYMEIVILDADNTIVEQIPYLNPMVYGTYYEDDGSFYDYIP